MTSKWSSFSKVQVVLPSNQLVLVPYVYIADKTALEALEYLQQQHNLEGKFSLFICTQKTKWNLRNELMSWFCRYIAIVPNESKLVRQSYLLISHDDDPINSFVIPICNFNGEFIMEYKCDLRFPFTFQDICYSLSNMFDVDLAKFVPATFEGNVITSGMPIDLILHNQVYIAADFGSDQMKSIKLRGNVMKEFLTNEGNYFGLLQTTKDLVLPLIDEYDVVDEKIMDIVQMFYSTAIIFHKEFLNELSERSFSFQSNIGDVLIKFANDLMVYKEYIEIFPTLSSKINLKKQTNLEFKAKCDIVQSDPAVCALDIISLLIRPVQRAPNYRMLTLRLIEVTPLGHLDYPPLAIALELLNKQKKILDESQQLSTSSERLEKELPGFALVDNEWYIQKYRVKGSNDVELILVLTSANFCILNEKQDEAPKRMQYVDVKVERNEITCLLWHPTFNTPRKIIFESEKLAEEFEQVMEETSTSFGLKNAVNEPGLSWSKITDSPMKLQRAGMVVVGKKMFIFGGRDECGILSSKLLIYEEKWEVIDTPLKERYDFCMCCLRGTIYIYGGISTSGNLDDFWSYDTSNSFWTEMTSTELSGPGLAMCSWKNEYLVLTGGDPFKTYLFNIEKNNWCEIAKGSKIPPISMHSLVENKRKLYIICGVTNSNKESDGSTGRSEHVPNRKSYVLNLSSNIATSSWKYAETIGLEPLPRIGHIAFSLFDHIWVIGGIGNSIPFCFSPSGQWFIFRNEGISNSPPSYSSVAVSNDDVFVFGGRTCGDVSPSLYKLTPTRVHLIQNDNIQAFF